METKRKADGAKEAYYSNCTPLIKIMAETVNYMKKEHDYMI